ncbi:MAG: hypothetical protein UZ19_OD1000556 [Parcubacteria bacterium OLB19]|nr:MAG: hypothetical protein UZ19_OD1000556 [Parcubacteria bacterium OLB19]
MKDFNEIIKLLDLDKNEQKILHILSDKVQLASSLQKILIYLELH